ncbi:hypothetical protein [Novacetimonas hansenii]|uniref:hypothetical protein n=1 Tax=Novacetimonas hansenii TaxID=436 RepID=UPI0030CBDF2D
MSLSHITVFIYKNGDLVRKIPLGLSVNLEGIISRPSDKELIEEAFAFAKLHLPQNHYTYVIKTGDHGVKL